MAAGPGADEISIREVLAKCEVEFAAFASAVENAEFALWVGSGISRNAPSLGDLIERALEFLRFGANDPATTKAYRPAFEEALKLANVNPEDLSARFATPIATWPERQSIVGQLWDNYSRLLDIRLKDKPPDFILWDAIDIRAAFAHPPPPAAAHLCIAILIMEGAVRSVASANWDGFIEAAIAKLSAGPDGVLQVVVDPNHMREPPGLATLFKFHGCIVYATRWPDPFRRYLTGSRTQITEWPDEQTFTAMRNALVDVATNQKTLVLGLSIQDNNIQAIFSRAKQVNAWPWPCAPQAPGHVFCEDVIRQGQIDVLKIVYGDTYNDNMDAIHAGTHLRAWGEQVLLALVLKLLTDKLVKLMQLALEDAEKSSMIAPLTALILELRNRVADVAVGDRTDFVNRAISLWSRMLSLFRKGAVPANAEAYEVVSNLVPNMLALDANAVASGLGRMAIALGLLQHGRAAGLWELAPPAAREAAAGALTARGTWGGSLQRPLFLVESATEAIRLEQLGAFANDNAIVVHADSTWRVIRGGGARGPGSAPGRTGRVRTTHVGLGTLIDDCEDMEALKKRFVAEMTL